MIWRILVFMLLAHAAWAQQISGGAGGGGSSSLVIGATAITGGGPGNLFTDGTTLQSSLTALNTVSSAQFGLQTYGDSITAGVGATSTTTLGYSYLMNTDFAVNAFSPFTQMAVSGYYASDTNSAIFTNLNPAESGNPIVTLMVGTNDVLTGFSAGYKVTYTQLLLAQAARASISNTNTVAGSNAIFTQAGSWANDTTFANLTGIKSSTNASTASGSIIALKGVLYVYYGLFATSGGTFTVSIDGVVATDTVTGNTTLTSQPGTAYSTTAGITEAVGLARYVVTPGTHTVLVTVTSATNAANPVTFFGAGIPPLTKSRGTTAAKIFLAGIPYQNNDASSATTAAVNATNLSVATTLSGDGLNVVWVDVRKYINSTLDMTGTITQNCPASTSVGLHPNNCGHSHLRDAFEDSINPTTATAAPFVVGAPVIGGSAGCIPMSVSGVLTCSASLAYTSNNVTNTIGAFNGLNGYLVNSGIAGLNATQMFMASNSASIRIGAGTDAILSYGGAGVWQHGAADAAAPVAQTIQPQSVVAGTSNTGGANFTIGGSKSTGTGVGGKIIHTVSLTGTTGSTQNSNFPLLTLNPGGATTATVQLGDGTNFTTYDSCTALTTGATGIIACTASALRFKTLRSSITPDEASRGLDMLRPGAPTWDYLDPDRYGSGTRVGLIADDVAAMDSRCIVKRDGEVADYWDRCVIAYLVADRQKMKAEIEALNRKVH
jgi:lysophospholipase L1-like esterase